MRIRKYSSGSGESLEPGKSDLEYSKISFEKMNLVVGDSASGKTRLLNTIFNGALLVTQSSNKSFVGSWATEFEHEGETYQWSIETGREDERARVINESLVRLNGNETTQIVKRTPEGTEFNGKSVPKLSPREPTIYLLREEDDIAPVHEAFSLVKRRNFAKDELSKAVLLERVPESLLKKLRRTADLDLIFSSNMELSAKHYVLSKYFSEIYNQIRERFQSVFPFVSRMKVRDASKMGISSPAFLPVLAMQEKEASSWIPISEWSAGMLKVLLIITDAFTLHSAGAVYLIDELENSLGVGAINFFPSALLDSDRPGQFIITSHHPYVIGNIPVSDWIVLHRSGSKVFARQGGELEERFGRSKQKAFIQLINDPFYTMRSQ